jgi:hypothetical protein
MRRMKFFVAALCAATAVGQSFPADNECATATTFLADGINPAPAASGFTFTNVGATTSVGTMCATFNNDVWFLYLPTVTGQHTIATCTPGGFTAGSMADTVLAVYDVCGGTSLACNDDATGCPNRSLVNVNLNAGTLYYVRVGEWGTVTPTANTFYVTVQPPLPPATNDDCPAATAIVDGPNLNLTNSGASPSADPATCATFLDDVWFYYVATRTGVASFSTGCGGTFDTVMAVYDNCGGVELGCNDNTAGCPTGGSTVTVNIVLGNIYFVRVGVKVAGVSSPFSLSVTEPPANDECVAALPVSLGINGPFNNHNATNSSLTGASCGAGGNKNDVWFYFLATCPGPHSISNGCAGAFDSVMSVYDACGGLEVACNDDTPGCGFGASTVTFTPTVGSAYLIRVASFTQGLTNVFNLTVSAGSGFALAFTAPLGPGSVQADFTGGAPSGGYVFALTLSQGLFPNGWLGGLDISLGELLLEIQTGFPFVGNLGPCGETTIGPFPGLPSGLQLFGGGISMNVLFGNVTAIAPAVSFTIP